MESDDISEVIGGKKSFADQVMMANKRTTVNSKSANKSKSTAMKQVFSHTDGLDPKLGMTSVTQKELEKENQKRDKSLKKYQKYSDRKNTSQVSDVLDQTLHSRKNSANLTSASKSANIVVAKKNNSTYNVINGEERTPQKITFSKKMYSKAKTSTIVGGEADISDNEDAKSVGRPQRVSAPWAQGGTGEVNKSQTKKQTNRYFASTEQSSPIKQNQEEEEIVEPLLMTKKEKPISEENDSAKIVFRKKQQAMEQNRLKCAQQLIKSGGTNKSMDMTSTQKSKSFVENLGGDSAKKAFLQKQKRNEDNLAKVLSYTLKPQATAREKEKQKLINQNNQGIVDSLKGDPMKKIHD